MQFMKRIFLFMLTNILVMLTIGLVFFVLQRFFPQLRVAGTQQLMVLALVWGFGGAMISLLLSKTLAKWGQGVRVIDPATATGDERWLVQTVHRLASQAGITGMPEVGVWESPEINAFCTGPSKNNSLVAVSTGIFRHMTKEELEGVLGHEISHAANGDMVTMTLIQGVVNSFVIFLSWIIANLLLRRNSDDRGGFGDMMMRHMVVSVLQMVLSFLAYVAIIAPFSRYREFRADAGGARLAGRGKMIAGLQALQDSFRLPQPAPEPSRAAMMISPGKKSNWMSTHPSIEERIAALKALPLA